jgi:small nuclear ribonucleoprotein (snRNP)-like protein
MSSSLSGCHLQKFINMDVVTRTSWGGEFVGKFVGYDVHMNVILNDATEIRRRPEIKVIFRSIYG